MILERAEHPDWLSNAYLIAPGPGTKGVLVDSNEVTEPLTDRVESDDIEITHLLLTHHHWDHVVGAEALADRYGVPIVAHELTAKALGDVVTETLTDGDTVESGDLVIEAIHTPGHCADHTALKVNDTDILTADVLFRGTVGGTMAPGATGFEDLKGSIMDKLMKLPPEMGVHPGHTVPSTIGDEWEANGFIRVWRGLDPEGDEPTLRPRTLGSTRKPSVRLSASSRQT